MKIRSLTKMIVAALLALPLISGIATAYELSIPSFDYRTGPYAPSGIPYANGFADYFTMLNERDGGINGAKIALVPCETGYNTKKGVECYENVKNTGESRSLVIHPLSTGITYQLIPKSSVDLIPIHSMGYGRTSAANGKIFPWVFNFPVTYWDGAAIFVKYIAEQEGGLDKLKGKKIALVYHNSAYGKEPIRTLEKIAEKYGFEFLALPVDHPGQEQKSTWLQIRQQRPDWVLMWGWGVMNQVAIKEAASIRFPMDHFIGVWWSGNESDVLPAGKDAHNFLAGAIHAPGADFPLFTDIDKHVYDKGKGAGEKARVGEVSYNRGVLAGVYAAEAIRTAMKIHGTNKVTPVMVRDGYEKLEISAARWEEMGLKGFANPVKITCENHAGSRQAAIMQWDANAQKWNQITDYYDTMNDVVDPLIAEDSAQYAKENGVVPRICG